MNITYLNSPIGLIKLASELSASCESSFSVQREMITEVSFVNEECQSYSSTELLEDAKNQLEEYFKKKRKIFDVKLNPQGSDFQKTVWNELLQIQYAKTTTYLEQSKRMGNVKAIRAVASANGKNPIWIINKIKRILFKLDELFLRASKLLFFDIL